MGRRLRAIVTGITVGLSSPAVASPFLNYLDTPVDVTPAATGWQDVNVSALAPPGATGVLVLYQNPTATPYDYGLRKKGSTDPFQVDAAKETQQNFLMTGLDANRTFQVYANNLSVKTYLYGYTMGGAIFFTNRVNKTVAPGGFSDVDISADTGGSTAIGAIFTVVNNSGNGWQFGLRKKGSSDNRVTDIRADTMTLGLIGVDSSEVAQMSTTSAAVELYLVGFVTHGARFFGNAVDKSTATEGAYVNVDISANILAGDDANGALLEINPSNNRRLTAIRNGPPIDLYQEMSHGFGAAGIDGSDVFQQKIEVDDMDLYLVGYSLGSDDCCELVVTEPASSITVVGAGEFEMTFSTLAGGGIRELYDLREDAAKANDLVGAKPGVGGNSEAWHSIGMRVAGANYNAGVYDKPKLELLEATPTRVRVRQETAYYNDARTIVLQGVRARGDYSVYAPGRVALRWTRRVTFPVSYQTEYFEQLTHLTAGAPLSGWLTYSELGGTTFGAPGTDDYLLSSIETGGARMDLVHYLYKDWTVANGYAAEVNLVNAGVNASAERINPGWVDTSALLINPGTPAAVQTWDLLSTFKPKTVADHTSTEVTDQRDDYRNPDGLTITVGQPWQQASENTSPGDDFNEAENAYVLTFDETLGLQFDIDGTVATPRHRPFFKIRRWHSLADPTTVDLEGMPLVNDAHYKADVKPLSRAHWAGNLLLHTTLQDAGSVDTAPDVGSAGTLFGPPTFPAGRYGNGALFDAAGEYLSFPLAAQAGNLVLSAGAVEFWLQPTFDHTDGAEHRLWGYSVDATHFFFFEKELGNDLRFRIRNAADFTDVVVTSADYSWQAGDWVHLRASWDASAPLADQARIFINGIEPTHTSPTTAYTSATMPNNGDLLIGADSTGSRSAAGIIDEFRVYSNAGAPQLLAAGGLASNPKEFLGSASRNFTLAFDPPDANGRGEYFYAGADGQFQGLNVALSTAGSGAGLDLQWEFWNGSGWSNLESGGFSDQTASFTRAGTVYWNDPSGWSPYSINGETDLYYVRAHLTAGSYSTPPTEALIKTDVLLFQYCGDVTQSAQTFDFALPVPTSVALESLDAVPVKGGIEIRWRTASELNNLGFQVLRSRGGEGPLERLTKTAIPGLGSSPVGASYLYLDRDVIPGVSYRYWIEDVETTGKRVRHGPVAATAGSAPRPADGDSVSARIAYGLPEDNAVRWLSQNTGGATLELVTRGFYAEPVEDGSVRLFIPGFDELSGPALPVKHVWIAGSEGRTVRVARVVEKERATFESLRPAEASIPELEARLDGTVRARRRRGRRGFQGESVAPELSARILSEAYQAGEKKAQLELAPLRWHSESKTLVLTERLVVHLAFGPERTATRRMRVKRSGGGARVQLATERAGLYAVRYEELGRRYARSESHLSLSRRGQTLAYHLEPPHRPFGPGSTLYFWSEGEAANPHGTRAVYELELGVEGDVMPRIDARPMGEPIPHAWFTERREENRYYQAALLDAEDLWQWEILLAPVAKDFSFEVRELARARNAAKLRVSLTGGSDLGAFEEHHVRFTVNGSYLGETRFEGKRAQIVELEIPDGVLAEGVNALTIENVGDSSAPYSMVFLDRFDVTYPRSTKGSLDAEWRREGTAEVEDAIPGSFVLDLSKDVPGWLEGLERDPLGTLRFHVRSSGRFLVAPALPPDEIRWVSSSSLLSPKNGADWLLIGPRVFLEAASPLVAHRRSQGLSVKAVSVEEIGDAFGHGEPSPEGIHAFLRHAYHEWKTPPRYLLLLGDGTYDFKDHLKTGVVNRVPPYMVRTSYLWTASDPAYASVHGDDPLPDLAVGRLPASDEEQVRRMVAKILRYETEPSSLPAPVVLVADNSDAAGDFERNVDELSATLLAGLPHRKLFLSELGAFGIRSEVVSSLEAGSSLISYVGHGGIHLWASENAFNLEDVAGLPTQSRMPLLLTMNCLNGYFHFPYFDSLAEAMVKAEGKGAIAAFSPSGLSLDDPAHRYHRFLLEELVHGAHERLGDAVLEAQRRYTESGAMPELLSIYHLLGDPALKHR